MRMEWLQFFRSAKSWEDDGSSGEAVYELVSKLTLIRSNLTREDITEVIAAETNKLKPSSQAQSQLGDAAQPKRR
jgi:hypothetical protein